MITVYSNTSDGSVTNSIQWFNDCSSGISIYDISIIQCRQYGGLYDVVFKGETGSGLVYESS